MFFEFALLLILLVVVCIAVPPIGLHVLFALVLIAPEISQGIKDAIVSEIKGIPKVAAAEFIKAIYDATGSFWTAPILSRVLAGQADFLEITPVGKVKSLLHGESKVQGSSLNDRLAKIADADNALKILLLDAKSAIGDVHFKGPILLSRGATKTSKRIRSDYLIVITDDEIDLEGWILDAPLIVSSRSAHLGTISEGTKIMHLEDLVQNAKSLIDELFNGGDIEAVLKKAGITIPAEFCGRFLKN